MSRLSRYRIKIHGGQVPSQKSKFNTYAKGKGIYDKRKYGLWFSKGEKESMGRNRVEESSEFTKWKKEHQYPNFVPKNWTECYKLPLHMSDYLAFAWDSEDTMALSSFAVKFDDKGQFIPGEEEKFKDIIKVINGEDESKFDPDWSVSECDPCAILYKGEFQFLVRGWGHLTGCGWALNLPPEMAEEMQDQFINYIIDKLNGK